MNELIKNLINNELIDKLSGRGDAQAYLDHYVVAPPPGILLESGKHVLTSDERDLLTEAIIVNSGRPGFLVQQGRFNPSGPWQQLTATAAALNRCLQSVGRIETHVGEQTKLIGTGWVYNNHIITNRHVAEVFFQPSPIGTSTFHRVQANPSGRPKGNIQPVKATIDFGGEAGGHVSSAQRFDLLEPVYLASKEAADLAVLRVHPISATRASLPGSLELALTPIDAEQPVVVVGYPAEISDRNPAPYLLDAFFQGMPGVKRVQPGFTTGISSTTVHYDCTTTGGNSGSPLLDVRTGQVVGVHYGGQFMLHNSAVPVAELIRVLQQIRLI